MPSLFQCVPNFSEGRNVETLSALQSAAEAPGAALADFSSDPDHNRCVATLVGDAPGLEGAILRMAAVAVGRIDLRSHSGQHPRLGALDVLPFIPLKDATMEDADHLAHQVGARIAADLCVPVYYYAHSASAPRRASLPAIRKALLSGQTMAPDEGPPTPHPTAGVVVAGARGPLIAFNVNLATADAALARRIARRVREAGGGLPGVRALGMYLASRNLAQVSVNITDTEVVSMGDVYIAVRDAAAEEGACIAEAELIGCATQADIDRAIRAGLNCPIRPGQVLDRWVVR